MDFLFIIFLVISISIIFLVNREEKNKLIWKKLLEKYSTNRNLNLNNLFIVYFWENGVNKDIDYFNSLSINIETKGLGLYPSKIKFGIKPVFIPWEEIKINGECEIKNEKYLVISVLDSLINIALPKEFESKIYISQSKA